MTDSAKPEGQATTKTPDQESIRALPVVGHLTALLGLSQYEDGHGHTLSGNALHCAGEAAPRQLTKHDADQLRGKVGEAAVTASFASSVGIDPGEFELKMTEDTLKNDPKFSEMLERGRARVVADMAGKIAGDILSGQYDLGTLESPLHTACKTGKDRER
jgi:hypothetical protein